MNKNVKILAALYDQATRHLVFLAERKGATEEATQAQVRWIGDLGRTLLVVNQIEQARLPSSSSSSADLPPPTPEKPEPRKPVI